MAFSKHVLCGRRVEQGPAAAPVPAQEILQEQGAIFSCGGVYLGLNRMPVRELDHFEYLHLARPQGNALVLNNLRPYRKPGYKEVVGSLTSQDREKAEQTLHRFFKESLN